MSSSTGMEEYYQKVIQLQEQLRHSEEERLHLEMKFNEMLQVMKEEEEAHFKKLRSKYKQFLEEDRRRQQRNDKILEALDRIENRTVVWEAKSEKFKAFKQRYHDYLKHASRAGSKADYDYNLRDRERVEPQAAPAEPLKDDIVEKYLQSVQKRKEDILAQSESLNFQPGNPERLNPQPRNLERSSVQPRNPDVSNFQPGNLGRSDFQSSNLERSDFQSSYLERPKIPENKDTARRLGVRSENTELGEVQPEDRYSNLGNVNSVYWKNSSFQPKTTKDYENSLKQNEPSLPKSYSGLKPRSYFDDEAQFSYYGDDEGKSSKQLLEERPEEKPLLERRVSNLGSLVNDTEASRLHSNVKHEVPVEPPKPQRRPSLITQQSALPNEQLARRTSLLSIDPGKTDGVKFEQVVEEPENVLKTDVQNFQDDHKGVHGEVRVKRDDQHLVHQGNKHELDVLQKQNDGSGRVGKDAIGQDERVFDQTGQNETYHKKQSYGQPPGVPGGQNVQNYNRAGQQYGQAGQQDGQLEQQYALSEQQYAKSGQHDGQFGQQDNQPEQQYDQPEQLYDQTQQPYDHNGQAYDQTGQSDQTGQAGQTGQAYDQTGQVYDSTKRADDQTGQAYDQTGQAYNQTGQAYDQTGQTYDQTGQAYDQTGQAYDQTGQAYDQTGQAYDQTEEVYDSSGQHYDENGQPLQSYDENAQPVTQYDQNSQPQYNQDGQPVLQHDENGQEIHYDEKGQPIQYDENGQAVPQYDENGQVIPVYDENGQEIPQYDQNGQLLTQYDQSGQLLTQYDQSNQPQYDESRQFVQQYDENGQPLPHYDPSVAQYDQNGQLITQYDDQGQPAIQYDENGQPVQQYYDENGQYYTQEPYPQTEGQPYEAQQYYEQPTEPQPKPNVMEMLETDTESARQDTTKISNDSDFDFSNN